MIRLACLGVLMLLVASCSTRAPVDTAAIDDRHWQLEGKLSISYGGETRVASIRWSQNDASGDIRLQAPFGVGRVRILVDEDLVTVLSEDGTRQLSPADGVLIDGATYQLPWDRLAWWVRGREGPGGSPLAAVHRDEDWQIRVLRQGPAGPELVEFRHPEVSLRLKVNNWRFGKADQGDNVI